MSNPFITKSDFLPILLCEEILENNKIREFDLDLNLNQVPVNRFIKDYEHEIYNYFKHLIPEIESIYDAKYVGLLEPILQCLPENQKINGKNLGCENSEFIRKKWVMKKNVDLVGYIWLNDYNNNIELGNFDFENEVYGGMLEFPQYNFHFKPKRGALVLFPAYPNFITAISPILVGNLYQIKLNICLSQNDGSPYIYNVNNHLEDIKKMLGTT